MTGVLNRLGNVIYYSCAAIAGCIAVFSIWSASDNYHNRARDLQEYADAQAASDRVYKEFKSNGLNVFQVCDEFWRDEKDIFKHLMPHYKDCTLITQANEKSDYMKYRSELPLQMIVQPLLVGFGGTVIFLLAGFSLRYILSGRTDFR